MAKFGLSKTIRSEVPHFAGSNMESSYLFGHNPRKARYSSLEGTSGRKPKKAGTTSSTAPLKTELQHFDSKHGFPGSFGRTGLTGET